MRGKVLVASNGFMVYNLDETGAASRSALSTSLPLSLFHSHVLLLLLLKTVLVPYPRRARPAPVRRHLFHLARHAHGPGPPVARRP